MAFITNLEGNFFYQLDRAEVFDWLTCTGVGDIDVPEGEPEAVYCPDPLSSGQLKLDGFVPGVPTAGTYSLTKPLQSSYNFLLGVNCAFVGRINWVCRGIRQDPQNYEVAVLMPDSTPRRRGIPAPVSNEATEARVNTNLDLMFSPLLVLHRITLTRQEIANTFDANAVFFLPERCEDRCGDARGMCEEGVMGLDGGAYLYLYASEIKKTHDGGVNWAGTLLDPYTWAGLTSAILMLERVGTERVLAFRGVGVPAAPAEVAITDDYGATPWDNRPIGAVMGQYVTDAIIWGGSVVAICGDGFVYRSRDQGQTWTIQYPGTTAVVLNDICYSPKDVRYGYIAANGNNLLYTAGGPGGTWAVRAGPGGVTNLLSCACNDKGHLLVGTDDGRVFRSEDGGVTWLLSIDLGGGTIDFIDFEPAGDYVGFLVHNDAALLGSVHRSEDGGASWFVVPGMPVNLGINAGHICDLNTAFFVGNVDAGGTTFVVKTEIA